MKAFGGERGGRAKEKTMGGQWAKAGQEGDRGDQEEKKVLRQIEWQRRKEGRERRSPILKQPSRAVGVSGGGTQA